MQLKLDKTNISYAFLILILITASILSLGLYFRTRTSHDKVDVTKFPIAVGGWKGEDIETTEEEYKILETRNLVSRKYTNTKGEWIMLFMIYSETNRSVFHPPEVCMMGSGFEMTDKTVDTMESKLRNITANKLLFEKQGYKELTLYCYKAGNLYTANYYLQQFYLAMHQVFGKNVPGATIRVSMALGADEKETLKTLRGFLKESIRLLEDLK